VVAVSGFKKAEMMAGLRQTKTPGVEPGVVEV
jgi:hypothetical protein